MRLISHNHEPYSAEFIWYAHTTSCVLYCGMPCRFPEFSLLSPDHDYTSVIDAVFISHFHMDHVGALPYFTEVINRLHFTSLHMVASLHCQLQ